MGQSSKNAIEDASGVNEVPEWMGPYGNRTRLSSCVLEGVGVFFWFVAQVPLPIS